MAATCSPSSLQLRYALASAGGGSAKSPPRLGRRQLWTHNRTPRRRHLGFSIRSDSNADGFSGWSGTDDGGVESSPPNKKWLGGAVGAGVAGIALAVGLSFAALSLRKPGVKHMEPLTTHQEESLSAEEKYDKFGGDEDEGQIIMQEEANTPDDGRTGTYESSSFSEVLDVPSENRVGDDFVSRGFPVDDVKNITDSIDNVNNVSFQEDLQGVSYLGEESVEAEKVSTLYNVSETEDVDNPLVASDDPAVDVAESIPNLEENLVDVRSTNPPASNPIILDYAGEMPESTSDQTSDYSSISHVLDEPLAPNAPFSLNTIVDTHITSSYSIEETTTLNTNFEVSDISLVATEENSLNLELDRVNEGGSSRTTMSESVHSLQNEQLTKNPNQINRRTSESPNPGTSFSSAGIPAPSVVFSALQVLPGKVLIPAVVDQVQGQALSALQVLKVIEADVQPSDICTRREYARWLVVASSALSRNSMSKVYPAMYIENVTDLAFDDITPEDPDFASIQGLAEAGLISSKLSRLDMLSPGDEDQSPLLFSPESPLSRQDLVSWKIAIEKRNLPEADRKVLYEISGFIDANKIHPDACPALVADLSSGEQGIIALAFGYTRLFQPDKPVTKAQAAIALAIGEASDAVSEELARIEAESMAENAVAAHNALVAQVEKDINSSFAKELSMAREKINAVEKMAEEATWELEKLRLEREEDNIALVKERAAIDSEMEVLSRLRREVEEQLETLLSNKVEISYEKEKISKLRKEAEDESQEIERLQYELEVERKALSMARSWAEDEAKRAREQAKFLEEARDRWEKHGIKVVVDDDLREETLAGVTWVDASKQFSVEETVSRAETLTDKLRAMAINLREKSRATLDRIIQKITQLILSLKEWASTVGKRAEDTRVCFVSKTCESTKKLQHGATEFSSAVKDGAKRVAEDCKEGVGKLTQKFIKT